MVPIPDLPQEAVERFHSLYARGPGCWPWLGNTAPEGYGLFGRLGTQYRAPRLALALAGRKPTQEQIVVHSCGNRRCVNPHHLEAALPEEVNWRPKADAA